MVMFYQANCPPPSPGIYLQKRLAMPFLATNSKDINQPAVELSVQHSPSVALYMIVVTYYGIVSYFSVTA